MARPVYARIQDVRDEGLTDTTAYPDARVLRLLEKSADIIEFLTKQYFGPKRMSFRRDGRNGRRIEEPESNKIIEITSLATVLPDEAVFPVSLEVYQVYPRYIALRRGDSGFPSERAVRDGGEPWVPDDATRGRRENAFPDDLKNVQVVGTFGWLEMGTKFSTTLASPLARRATKVVLTDVGDLETDDVLHIDSEGSNFWVIVGEVYKVFDATLEVLADTGTQVKISDISKATIGDVVTIDDGTTSVVITVTGLDVLNSRIQFAAVTLTDPIAAGAVVTADALPGSPGTAVIDPSPKSAASDATVVRWGRVPRMLRYAYLRTLFAQKDGAGATTIGKQYLMKKEKTDNYDYEVGATVDPVKLASGTGDPIADTILSQFRAPPFVSFV